MKIISGIAIALFASSAFAIGVEQVDPVVERDELGRITVLPVPGGVAKFSYPVGSASRVFSAFQLPDGEMTTFPPAQDVSDVILKLHEQRMQAKSSSTVIIQWYNRGIGDAAGALYDLGYLPFDVGPIVSSLVTWSGVIDAITQTNTQVATLSCKADCSDAFEGSALMCGIAALTWGPLAGEFAAGCTGIAFGANVYCQSTCTGGGGGIQP